MLDRAGIPYDPKYWNRSRFLRLWTEPNAARICINCHRTKRCTITKCAHSHVGVAFLVRNLRL